ncbi:argininosuccinate synthase [bacterium BMS3Abin07]|nr:argininosuccinate synthase [bacterium BMS3Abin07]GBE32430.1 argininosuccinate synthase [bacterium BMS3Bbin05]HDL21385.1 argininosuccinate synthase [Nitrospirota bacterium]HDO22166.1 argininosuccinate synthase [Nitrospirota bacterium]HDZ87938.1 argininosuccinate synthase [Nitrospirota bacterium]
MKKVVLAYSGGLDTSIAIQWIKDEYDADVIAYCADLGQEEDLGKIKAKALKTGASKVFIEDLREEFVRDYIFPMLRGCAVYEGTYLLGTSIARPLISKRQVEIALEEGADTVAHGATGKGNDQIRFELSYYALNPGIKVIAPWRHWPFRSREALIDYASEHGIEVPVTREKPYSTDINIFHISYEGGVLEDPWAEPPDEMHKLCTPVENTPDSPSYIEIGYEKGNPVTLNGRTLPPFELLRELNGIAGKNGIGRVDIVENRFVGMKSRGVYETPGGTVLHIAHRAMESITLDREAMHLRDSLISKYAELIYYGFWFSPEREAIQRLIDETQGVVNGTVRLKLFKGNCIVVGRKSPDSLYDPELATFGEEHIYDQADAEGFIKLNALRLKMRKIKQPWTK